LISIDMYKCAHIIPILIWEFTSTSLLKLVHVKEFESVSD
jgi:hypothetical protein